MNNKNFKFTYQDYRNFTNFMKGESEGEVEAISPVNFFSADKEGVASDVDLKSLAESFFKGRIIDLPDFNIVDKDFDKFTSFETFTSTNEVHHIALWSLAVIKDLTNSDKARYGRELEIIQSENPRDGRLDVAMLLENQISFIETKTTLKSALSENRFVFQMSNYTKEIINILKEQKFSLIPLLSLGGEESDLYPPDHPDCTTGQVGNMSKIFYEKCINNNIKFISANALWALYCYAKVIRPIDIKDIFEKINEENCVGLLTAGLVKNEDNKLSIEPFEV